jgi:hypothetical protein
MPQNVKHVVKYQAKYPDPVLEVRVQLKNSLQLYGSIYENDRPDHNFIPKKYLKKTQKCVST